MIPYNDPAGLRDYRAHVAQPTRARWPWIFLTGIGLAAWLGWLATGGLR